MNDNEITAPKPDEPRESTWAEIVGPIVQKFHASGALGLPVVTQPEGCTAMAKMLANMARRLDKAGIGMSDPVTTKGNEGG